MTSLNGKHIVFLGYVWPEPSSSAAGVRTISLVNHALKAGAKVTFLSPSKTNSFSDALNALGVATHEIAANDSGFDILIKDLNPDTVVFDRFVLEEQFSWRVAEACPKALRVIDSQDIHFLRKERERALSNGDAPKYEGDEVLRELSSVYRSHKTLVLSDAEMHLLTNFFKVPPHLLQYLPICYEKFSGPIKTYSERNGFLFLGNFRHPPNLEGIQWFLDSVFPLLKSKMPTAEVHLYGAYPPKEIASRHSPAQGVYFHGLASEGLEELLNYRVNLAPLRFGAGIKGKIADGWRFGLPCVSTEIGAEGMQLGHDFGGLITKADPLAFAEACIALHEEESIWQKSVDFSNQILTQKFSTQKNQSEFINLLATLNAESADNLFGKILWWNQHRSTEYFSRWIEEKNKKKPPQS